MKREKNVEWNENKNRDGFTKEKTNKNKDTTVFPSQSVEI